MSNTEQAEKIIAKWRKVFLGIYLAFVASACVVTLFSILAVHWGAGGVPIKSRRISPGLRPGAGAPRRALRR